MIRDAVRTGIGAALLPLSLVAGDLRAGTLVHWGDGQGPPIAPRPSLDPSFPRRWDPGT